jgi:hypothetical protein
MTSPIGSSPTFRKDGPAPPEPWRAINEEPPNPSALGWNTSVRPSGDSGFACGSFRYRSAARPNARSGLRRVIWRHEYRFSRGASWCACGNLRFHCA